MAGTKTCYFPDGSEATSDTPCQSLSVTDGAIACCNSLDVCLENHLCLAQTGGPMISRGSCTDPTWESEKCSQYCADVGRKSGQWIYPLYGLNNNNLFCCGQAEPSTNSCTSRTKGSTSPFLIEDGPVIFNNHTYTSAVPKYTNTTSITATATATSLPTATTPTSSASSSRREAGIGAGVGGFLGLALLVMSILLWRQRKHQKSLSKDLEVWERRYSEMMMTNTSTSSNRTVGVAGVGHHHHHQSPAQQWYHGGGWNSNELDGDRPRLPPPQQLEGWVPNELDGTQHRVS